MHNTGAAWLGLTRRDRSEGSLWKAPLHPLEGPRTRGKAATTQGGAQLGAFSSQYFQQLGMPVLALKDSFEEYVAFIRFVHVHTKQSVLY